MDLSNLEGKDVVLQLDRPFYFIAIDPEGNLAPAVQQDAEGGHRPVLMDVMAGRLEVREGETTLVYSAGRGRSIAVRINPANVLAAYSADAISVYRPADMPSAPLVG
jgi:hypothetical protein